MLQLQAIRGLGLVSPQRRFSMHLCRWGSVLRAALAFSLLSFTVFAQSERGNITGSVHDASGAVVPAAKITVTNAATNVAINAASNEQGEYTVPNLQPGTYTVRIEKEGFRPTETKGLSVDAGSNVRSDATLEVGAATQAIEVQA